MTKFRQRSAMTHGHWLNLVSRPLPWKTVFVERGREHAFRIIGDVAARMVTAMTPGGFEGFFPEMAQGRFRIPEDMEQVGASAVRHGLRLTGPPLGAE